MNCEPTTVNGYRKSLRLDSSGPMCSQPICIQKPKWLRRHLPSGPEYEQIKALIRNNKLHTVCQEAQCPNQFECFSKRTAAFLILGSICTRNCRFCNIETGPSGPPDPEEPLRVAEAAASLQLRYVVVTSVTRDDLPDGGAGIFAQTIKEICQHLPRAKVEVLIPDFQGDKSALQTVLRASPDILNHNIETVSRLYPEVRPQADYLRSLQVLFDVSQWTPAIASKSGIMLGLGETNDEIEQTLQDIYDVNCRILTLGQYLQPSAQHLPVQRFIPPKEFEQWREVALQIGYKGVASGPFVRSSYHAHELYNDVKSQG